MRCWRGWLSCLDLLQETSAGGGRNDNHAPGVEQASQLRVVGGCVGGWLPSPIGSCTRRAGVSVDEGARRGTRGRRSVAREADRRDGAAQAEACSRRHETSARALVILQTEHNTEPF